MKYLFTYLLFFAYTMGFSQYVQDRHPITNIDWLKDRVEWFQYDAAGNLYMTTFLNVDTQTDRDVGLIKFDADRNFLWHKRIATTGKESGVRPFYLIEGDGIYYCGSLAGVSTPQTAGVLTKFDFDGNELWSLVDTVTNWRGEDAVYPTLSGDVIWTGTSTVSGETGNPIMHRVTSEGVVKQEARYPNSRWLIPDESAPTSDGGLILVGKMENDDLLGDFDVFLLKADKNLDVEWVKRIGTDEYEHPSNGKRGRVIQTADGGYLATHFRTGPLGFVDHMVIKTDALGAVEWTTLISCEGGALSIPATMDEASDGSFLLGHTVKDQGLWHGNFTKIGSDGSLLENRQVDESTNQSTFRHGFMNNDNEGEFLISRINTAGTGLWEVELMTIDLSGSSGCPMLYDEQLFTYEDITSEIHEADVTSIFVRQTTDWLTSLDLTHTSGDEWNFAIACSSEPLPVSISGERELCPQDLAELKASGDTSYIWYEAEDPATVLSDDSIFGFTAVRTASYVLEGGDGGRDTAYVELKDLSACPHLIIPEVYELISNNGDGDNENLVIANLEHYEGNTVKIFNSWGDLVFNKTDYESGTWTAEGLPDGSYFYEISIEGYQKIFTGRLVVKQ